MGDFVTLIMFVSFLVILILVMRLLGAWMFRINEIINNQKEIIQELKKLNKNQ